MSAVPAVPAALFPPPSTYQVRERDGTFVQREPTVGTWYCGFEADEPAQGTGLGSRILTAMARNLDAELNHDRSRPGTRVVVDFPLDVHSSAPRPSETREP